MIELKPVDAFLLRVGLELPDFIDAVEIPDPAVASVPGDKNRLARMGCKGLCLADLTQVELLVGLLFLIGWVPSANIELVTCNLWMSSMELLSTKDLSYLLMAAWL